jgi:N-glycosylase/DNA lyase
LTGTSVESHLRELRFGYRAKYIAETARIIAKERPRGWLLGLRNPNSQAWGNEEKATTNQIPVSYKEAHEQLVELSGVGPKVADCVCLMGLGWGEAVPIDTHVWQIAVRDYKFGKNSKTKTMNKAMYDSVGDHFRALWGKQAGWAHSVLFTADLRTFADRLLEKKEEVLVEIKQEAVSEDAARPSKRRRIAVAEIVKTEEVENITNTTVTVKTRTSKRRKTRS